MGLKGYIAEGGRISARNEAIKGFNASNAALQKDIKAILDKLKTIPKEFEPKARKKVLAHAARPLIAAAQANAPVMRTRTKQLITLKSGGKAMYFPGNLRLSVKVIPWAKSKSVWVGPKIDRKRKEGNLYGRNRNMVDAFYAGFLEFGTRDMAPRPFMRPAFDATKGAVINEAAAGFEKVMAKWIREHKV